jgi:SNF2 family DNA or RNA helicase
VKFTPRVYQKRAIKALLANPHFGLLLKPGLGKTSITLAALRILLAKEYVDRVLIVAPLRVCYEVWPMEIDKWDEFKFLNYRILHGKTKNLDDLGGVQVCMINHEGLPWLFAELLKRMWPFDWLVIDESTRFKKTNTVRFKLIKNHLARFSRRTILTGTPTPNGVIDIFGQIFCVDLGKSLGRFITHFRNEFFDSEGFGGYTYVAKPGAEKRILERIKPITLSMTQEDWLEMPELITNVVTVKLPPAARKVYDAAELSLLLTIEKETNVVPTVAAALMKCRQIASGGVYFNEREARHLHDAKIDALESIVEELEGSPLLVVYEFHHELERIRERFGEIPALHGGMKPAVVSGIIRDWNAGRIPLLAAQPQTTATGLNLQDAGNTIAWMSLTWDAENYEQLINRVWRSGQKADRVVVHHIIAENTVDEIIHESVAAKWKSQSAFVNGLKRMIPLKRR